MDTSATPYGHVLWKCTHRIINSAKRKKKQKTPPDSPVIDLNTPEASTRVLLKKGRMQLPHRKVWCSKAHLTGVIFPERVAFGSDG